VLCRISVAPWREEGYQVTSKHGKDVPATAVGASDRGFWALGLLPMGALVCCGGSALAGWLASIGLVSAVGVWWAHLGAGGWLGVAVLLFGGWGALWYGLTRARQP
jgi:hypothetical protein